MVKIYLIIKHQNKRAKNLTKSSKMYVLAQ